MINELIRSCPPNLPDPRSNYSVVAPHPSDLCECGFQNKLRLSIDNGISRVNA